VGTGAVVVVVGRVVVVARVVVVLAGAVVLVVGLWLVVVVGGGAAAHNAPSAEPDPASATPAAAITATTDTRARPDRTSFLSAETAAVQGRSAGWVRRPPPSPIATARPARSSAHLTSRHMSTAAGRYPHLLAPGRIGTLVLRNRILMCPMGDLLANPDGTVGDDQAAYFEARARGGAACLIVGSVSVAYPRGSFSARQLAASGARHLPGLADLAARVHRHGALIAAQLVHNGRMSLHDAENGLPMLVPAEPRPPAPDRLSLMVGPAEMAAITAHLTGPRSRLAYRVATDDDCAEVVEQFAAAAARCAEAGFDAVELHAGHGYLIDEFLSPAHNTRTDRWGGSVEGRARLLLEIIGAIRARLGRGFPLWIRINARELHEPRGETFDDQRTVIAMAEAAGIDAVHLTAYASTDVATGPTDSYVPHTRGPLVDWAAAVRADTGVPVITFGRLTPEEADAVIADGKADFVAMGRPLLADPDLPAKLAAGSPGDVRPCIYQYRCIGNIFLKQPLRCAVNAATGREGGLPAPSRRPRRVLVVGGGPAGLEAAVALAEAGHAVEVWEATDHPGGLLRLAAACDETLAPYLAWLTRRAASAGVRLELGRRATAEEIAAAGADEVVLATGARWQRPAVALTGATSVALLPELAGWAAGGGDAVGERVVVVGGNKPGLSFAGLCARRGHQVTVVEPTGIFGASLGLPGRFRLVADLEATGVRLVTGHLTGATAGGVTVAAGDAAWVLPADTVVVAEPARAAAPLAAELDALGRPARLVGDCRSLAGIEGATADALALAGQLA
jgi:2,4-dienoyl-CoA reductase (NADPH2)